MDASPLSACSATFASPAASTAPGRLSARGEDVVTRLQQSELFRDYQDAFQTATGLPLTLRPAGSFQPPLHGCRLTNAFCALMIGASRTCATCLQLQQEAESGALNGAKTVQCFSGMSESVVPIRVGEQVIAYLQTLGGTPTVTPQTAHRYYTPPAVPGAAPAPAGAVTP